MNIEELLDSRYSCRAFTDRPVSRAQVERIAALAAKAPSWGNTQPWKLYAVGGDKAKEIRRRLVADLQAGREKSPELAMPDTFPEDMTARYKNLGKALFTHLGIARGDVEARKAHYARNYGSFGAPCLLLVTVPKDQSAYVVFDAGAYVFGLCLAAAAEGLGTVIVSTLVRYPDQVREVVQIPEDEALVIGVAMGYPDTQSPGATFRSQRRPVDEVLTTFELE